MSEVEQTKAAPASEIEEKQMEQAIISIIERLVGQNERLRAEIDSLRERDEELKREIGFCAFEWLDERGTAYHVEMTQLSRYEFLRAAKARVRLVAGPTREGDAAAAASVSRRTIDLSAGRA